MLEPLDKPRLADRPSDALPPPQRGKGRLLFLLIRKQRGEIRKRDRTGAVSVTPSPATRPRITVTELR